MTAKEYRNFKGLRKESLLDNMDNIELTLTDLSEEATKRLAIKKKPKGLKEKYEVVPIYITKEKERVVIKINKLNYNYIDNKDLIEK